VNVVIAGGGTAGHVYPAIALADRLRDGGAEVAFVGSESGQEAKLVPEAGYGYSAVRAQPMRREISTRTLKAPFIALGSVRACAPLVRGADVVVGVGGYVSVPAVLAARRACIPIVLHEQNAVPSLSNRMSARFARAIGVSFDRSRSAFPARARVEVTGNPVRRSIVEVPDRRTELIEEAHTLLDLRGGRTTVAVFGGSLGALHLDQVVAEALARPQLKERGDLQVLVLTGPDHLDVLARPAPDDGVLVVRALAYLDRMELALAMTDLAVARAGAGHIAELTTCGIPSILVPYPHATENHQEANARALVDVGAAELYPDAHLSADGLANRIIALVDDSDRRLAMGQAARAWSRPDADVRLADLVTDVAG
jgi:UDP-N-acetylglucosamine--N-acetylmuramyl-(pentapeptide) pyrophosphoryl-undecaprenol N-acetylglucosamine transferase